MLKALKYCLVLTTFISAIAQTPDDMTGTIQNSEIVEEAAIVDASSENNHVKDSTCDDLDLTKQCKELFIDTAQTELLELVIFAMTLIIHELGHAVSTKLLFDTNDPIEMHIGTRTPETMPRLFSLGNMHFYKTIPWVRGLMTHGKMHAKHKWLAQKKIDRVISFAAGGLSAAALMYYLLVAMTGYCAYKDKKEKSEITLKSFINAASPFSYIVNTKAISDKQKSFLLNAALVICLSLMFQLFYGCTVYCNVGDGNIIWEKLIGVTGTPLKIAHVLSIVGVWACWMFILKKYCDARKKLSPQDSKMRIPAALIAFLLMYYQLIPKE